MSGESNEMPKAYDPSEVETRWYEVWEREGYFRASDDPDDERETFAIAIPPPNITGTLHMGHACRTTFEDVLTRYNRMLGKNTLWVPGTDHAGIATQIVVERQLKREGLTRHDLGREKFIERVWAWKEESGGTILRQLRRMGASCDWSRTHFTMQPELVRAVREAFVRLYEEGLIYRSTRLVNWDVAAQTVLSDLEVEQQEGVQGELFDFAYTLEDDSGEIVVSTTRPETMLGDTAVAVHPADERYKAFHGKRVRHPFVDRLVAVITDAELVNPEFGTGAVKVTPAHDPNDFATGKRHGLEEINIFELDGRLNQNGGKFAGMDRFEARKAVKRELEALGFARGSKKHTMTLPKSQRSGTVVEPMISTQWFVKTEPLAKPAIEVVESGKIEMLPEEWKKTYFHWLRNIQDWCISRQLWWGHQIPAWYCGACEHVNVCREDPSTCENCGSEQLTQDDDVLDTWFSSGLWPFSTLGWPDETVDLKRFYPTQDMETGYDIIFFWVARMIMMGLHFMGEVPFTRVLLAGMVTDERGEKMSKMKGNVVDPLDVIDGATLDDLLAKAERGGASEKGLAYVRKTYPEGFAPHGADALRMTLLSYSPQAHRISLSIKRIEGYRNFSNKLWNASRFTLMRLAQSDAIAAGCPRDPKEQANRWILSRLHGALSEAREGIDAYRLDQATQALYHFVWDEFCDWYLEKTKYLLDEGDEARRKETEATLLHVLETILRALHPMMPFITEEIWQRIPKAKSAAASIMISSYPRPDEDARQDHEAEDEEVVIQAATTGARTARSEHEQPRSRRLRIALQASDEASFRVLGANQGLIESLTNSEIELVASTVAVPAEGPAGFKNWAPFISPSSRGWVDDVVDVEREKDRLGRELKKLDKQLTALEKKLANANFVDKAPADKVAEARQRAAELTRMRDETQKSLARLG